MTLRHALMATALALAGVLILPDLAATQVRIGDRARRQVERRIEKRAEVAVEKALDRTEEGVRCVFSDAECVARAKSGGQEVVYTDVAGNPTDEKGQSAPTSNHRPGEGAWANFDFVPGDRVLFVEDFASDRVGNFPRRLEFGKGNLEIVEWNGGRYLRSTAQGSFDVVLPEALPKQFTLEFDLFDADFWPTEVYSADPNRKLEEHWRLFFSFNGSSGLKSGHRNSQEAQSSMRIAPTEKMMRVSAIADGAYIKVFLDDTRISNIPNADFARTNRVRFDVAGSSERVVLIGNIRIAAGSTSLYDALQADGRVTTQGILFDTGSDRIRPESTPTLKEIVGMLKEHGSLRLMIEGHTDNVGQAASNQALSEKRAAAVKAHLVGQGIDAARLQSVGKGQSEPAGSNETPEGRQNNRRVVLVRQ
jgi:OmpA-OmpF porin, OOP family